MDEILWAVRVAGPDDVLAMPDWDTAMAEAGRINDVAQRLKERPDASELDPIISASVVEWPYSRDAHAEGLAEYAEAGGYLP